MRSRKFQLLFIALSLCSCSTMYFEAAGQNGGRNVAVVNSLFGKQAAAVIPTPFGDVQGYVTDNTDLARDVRDGVVAYGAAKALMRTTINAANNETARIANSNAASVSKATIKARGAVTGQAIQSGAEVLPIQVIPP